MLFRIDKQTIKDIELFPDKEKGHSIFTFYNRAVTNGGQERLYEIMKTPISDLGFLLARKQEIEYFTKLDAHLKLNARQVDYIEHYLRNRRIPLKDNIIDAAVNGIVNKLRTDPDYFTITEGIFYIIHLLTNIGNFLKKLTNTQPPKSLERNFQDLTNLIDQKSIRIIILNPPKSSKDLSFLMINKLDYLFRLRKKKEFRKLLDIIYDIDVLQSLSILINQENLTLPEYTSDQKQVFEATDYFHLLLEAPVPNSFSLKNYSNLCFITGPNMSGKSTFMKTVGLLVYLSHIGFPVPAKKFKTSLHSGLFTTINLTDSLSQGFSHFYSEVKRVKDMSLEIQSHKNLVVIIDELFRGTNVKDAFDATLMVITSLSQIKGCLFFVSSHILEVAEELITSNNIDFRCFESNLKNLEPVYDYKLKDGISKERIGMYIIRNEKIKSILDQIIKDQEI